MPPHLGIVNSAPARDTPRLLNPLMIAQQDPEYSDSDVEDKLIGWLKNHPA